MDHAALTAWFLLMFPLVYSPGPANTMFASNGALFGFRRSLPFMAGIDTSFVLQSLLVGFGLNEVLLHVPHAMLALKIAGIAYIAYLALGFFASAAARGLRETPCLNYRDGFIFTFLNPKAWVMQAMMFSQFLDAAQSAQRVLALTALLGVLNISGHVAWIRFGELALGRAEGWMTPQRQNLMFGAMLLLSIAFML
jgi:threonine/homoserine/homoserine lactone efflux protein